MILPTSGWIVDDDAKKEECDCMEFPSIGGTMRLKAIIRKYKIAEVIISIPSASGKD